MESLFWISLGFIIYTFIGYGVVIFILVHIKRFWSKKSQNVVFTEQQLPSCSLLIAAYNEESCIRAKIQNTLSLNYPIDRLKIFIVTDGSTDKTSAIISEFPQINLLSQNKRKGKICAVNRAMKFIVSEIVIFTDANTFLNKNALINICRHYKDPNIGGVAGEKRIYISEKADASTTGENFYWKYESKLKQWDSELYSTIGAAGELFSIRRKLYKSVSEDTILDDFMISMQIAMKGYKIIYEPEAYAIETSSLTINEELKRKIRIAAGGIQAIHNLKPLLNPLKYPTLSLQYISHRVLRWSITPFLLIISFILNLLLSIHSELIMYKFLISGQIIFYVLATFGFWLQKQNIKLKIVFIPYYFCIMNYAIIAGMLKYYRNEQSSTWEKVKRKEGYV